MGRYEPTYHTIVAVDVADSGQLDDRQQLRMRDDLRTVIDAALRRQGLDAAPADRTDLGDGVRLIFPASVSPCGLLDPFVPHLAAALRRPRQADIAPALRLRVVVHAGLLHRDGTGWAGAPLVHCARLLDAAPVRRALRVNRLVDLVLVTSTDIYDSVVVHGYGLPRSMYRPVWVRAKETSTRAWLYLPDRVGRGVTAPAPSDRT